MPITKLGQCGFLLKTRIAEIETFVHNTNVLSSDNIEKYKLYFFQSLKSVQITILSLSKHT